MRVIVWWWGCGGSWEKKSRETCLFYPTKHTSMSWRVEISKSFDENKQLRLEFDRRLVKYITNLRKIIKWGIVGNSLTFSVYLSYSDGNMMINKWYPLYIIDRKSYDQIMYLVQDFFINCYYENERDWEPISLKDISTLLWIWVSSVADQIYKTQAKIKHMSNSRNLQ